MKISNSVKEEEEDKMDNLDYEFVTSIKYCFAP